MCNFDWPNFHEFPISPKIWRPQTWSIQESKHGIPSVDKTTISEQISVAVSTHLTAGSNPTLSPRILAHSLLTAGKIRPRIALKLVTGLRYPTWLRWESSHWLMFCLIQLLLAPQGVWFTIRGDSQSGFQFKEDFTIIIWSSASIFGIFVTYFSHYFITVANNCIRLRNMVERCIPGRGFI
jgi:hypothetical protein